MTPGGKGAADSECLDEIALAELAEGRSDAPRRDAYVAHLAECARCRQQLASIVELLSDQAVAAELATGDDSAVTVKPRRGWLRAIPLVAAAAVVAIALQRDGTVDRSPVPHRESTSASESSPTRLTPSGDVSDASVLRWSALAGADLYRVTLYDASSRVLYEASVRNTTATLPDSIVIVPGRSYLWKVEARTSVDRWTSSELTEFRLTRARDP